MIVKDNLKVFLSIQNADQDCQFDDIRIDCQVI